MRPSADAATEPAGRRSWRSIAGVAALIAAGFALTIWVFYPGVMTHDSRYIYQYAKSGDYGDWQSPLTSVLWAAIDPLDPGPGSMFLVTAVLYWLAFGFLALTIARDSPVRAVVLVLLAFSPPAFIFLGMIWRDIPFAILWLGAAGLGFAAASAGGPARLAFQATAIALLALGLLLRPNALAAAPILAAFLLWPNAFSWKRAAVIYAPVALAGFLLVQVVYYGMLDAKRQHPLQSIMVFDLGGITHFAKQNQFPGRWTPAETTMLTGQCYQPTVWDIYWTRPPCLFVMQRLEAENIFGTPALVDAWWRAVLAHPLAYLQHRAAFMWTFLAEENVTIWLWSLDEPTRLVDPDNARLAAVGAVNDALVPTPVLRAGTWLLLCGVICFAGWRQRRTAVGAFALGACGSAIVYVLTLTLLGVATDFRYAYWAVLAGLAGAVLIWPADWPSWAARRHSPAVLPPS